MSIARTTGALLVWVVLLMPVLAAAQTGFPFGEASMALYASNENPNPGSAVTITAESYSIDLENSSLAWYVNGSLVEEGEGITTRQIVAGALGSETYVSVVAENNGETARAELLIAPVEIDVLWEATSYTPALYKGRALASAGSEIRAVALVRFVNRNGTTIDPKNITYTWKINGNVIPSISGKGKTTARIPSPELFGTNTVSLEAVSSDNTRAGNVSYAIPSFEPQLAIYQKHPLFGTLFNDALRSDVQIRENELTLTAIPYFAKATKPTDAKLAYLWSINGTRVPSDEEDKHLLTINAEGSTGRALVGLEFNDGTLFGEAKSAWNVFFNSSGSILDIFRNPFGT